LKPKSPWLKFSHGLFYYKEEAMQQTNYVGRPRFPRVRRDPVKLTALLYLREVLLREVYEEAADIIAIAKEFGAQAFEIDALLEDPRRFPKV